ncbi:hypothetical protein CHU92_06790 [Flavobacterium cyanobacteriorum]|uniref:DUF4249 domain-containing protein n=1 Tax=Flavobacterium cyanobacteriorum TaxID=2022802 RepID=A0A255Z9G1_9FLAO|nr:DUF4249 domain-containing protein [Flavobacterium cyanobacteriorum]OYQ38051.1 hypothetical protein CHU92_06790 [Flavobacterium cyanobacteriorum]
MKTFLKYCFWITTFCVCSSCEEEISLEITGSPSKLVVEGNVLHGLDTLIQQQQIRLSLSAGYLGNSMPSPVTDALVRVVEGSHTYLYTHTGNGLYTSEFSASAGKTYKLLIDYAGNSYEATEFLKPGGAAIESLSVRYFPSALGSPAGNFITLNTADPIGERNFYLWQLYINGQLMVNPSPGNIYRAIQKDDFFNGQPLLNYLPYDNFPVVPGNSARMHQLNISEAMYNYYYSIFNLTGSSPFSGDVPPGNIRGNVLNTSDPQQNALGYFGACTISIKTKNL